ncbi:MAG: putative serine metalloprotease precursor [Fibrobacteres bacterium]|nr:putative serine metalloprotease precursor [Fibrobacterota bacterium]
MYRMPSRLINAQSLWALVLLLGMLAEAAGPSLPVPWLHRRRAAADPALSSHFLPATMQVRGPAQLAVWRALLSRHRQDSTRHWELRGDRLIVSYDLVQDLAGGNLPNTGAGLADRLATFLARSQGGEFRSAGSAFGTYLPDDEWLVNSPQWALRNSGGTIAGRPGKAGVDIGIERVWDKFSGSDSLIVAVVDAGFDFNHPDLRGRNWINKAEAGGIPGVDDDANGYVDDSLGWDFVENDNLPQDRHGHGTYVSSVIGAGFDDHLGMAGILAQCRIMPVRVLDASGHGDQAQIAKGILYAVRNGAKVINFSIGGDGDNAALRSAFQAAHDAGVPIVVAAGNDGQDINLKPAYPASYNFDNMLVVAAHDHAGLLCAFSNFGATSVHLAAPGELILVAGLPDPVEILKADFEPATVATSWIDSGFAISALKPVAGSRSLAWVSGNRAVATFPDTLDLTRITGATLHFRLDYTPANGDVVIVEGLKAGAGTWTEIAVIGQPVSFDQVQAYGLHDLDGAKSILRFRTSLAARFSSAGRVLRIDDIVILAPDPSPPAEPVYTVVAGTSLAAPHVTAYLGLQRLACDRTGVPWSRALALAGTVPESSLAGRVSTGGRLDVYKGLRFYLATLPDFRVLDSTANTWKGGEKVEYDLSLTPNPPQAYTFTETGLPQGASIDGSGKLTWTPGPQQAGEYTARLMATGPTVLRKLIHFKVEAGVPVAAGPAANTPPQRTWTVAGQAFRLPPGLGAGRHMVEVFGTDAAGKVRLLDKGWMDAEAFSGGVSGTRLPGAAWKAMARMQVRVDGIFLVSAR